MNTINFNYAQKLLRFDFCTLLNVQVVHMKTTQQNHIFLLLKCYKFSEVTMFKS